MSSPAHESNTWSIYHEHFLILRFSCLTYLSTRQDLPHEEIRTDICDPAQEHLGLFGVLVQPTLALFKRLASSSFDHIRHERPWSAHKANQWHSACQTPPGQGDSFEEIPKLFVHIDILAQSIQMRWINEGLRQDRTLGRLHEYLHAQCLGDDEDVAEYYTGIEGGVSVDRLKSQSRSDRRGLTTFKERMVLSNSKEFYASDSYHFRYPCTHLGGIDPLVA